MRNMQQFIEFNELHHNSNVKLMNMRVGSEPQQTINRHFINTIFFINNGENCLQLCF